MQRLSWLVMFATLVAATVRYRARRRVAAWLGTMFDPFHFTTLDERRQRAVYRVALTSKPWSDDFDYVTHTAERVLARLRTEAA